MSKQNSPLEAVIATNTNGIIGQPQYNVDVAVVYEWSGSCFIPDLSHVQTVSANKTHPLISWRHCHVRGMTGRERR